MKRRMLSALLIVSTCLFSWLAMMAVHEFGHVLHAWLSGGRVERVVLHPLAISRTDVNPNPNPAFVAWGGFVWGSALPLALVWAVRQARLRDAYLFQFFAGFCLIANGAYLASAGIIAAGCGLWLWNGLGPRFGLGHPPCDVDPRAALKTFAALVVFVVLEWWWEARR
jgi:hypothetical protein